jgi:hypothetical protein
MKKIVINTCFGGFGLSPEAILWIWKNGGGICAIPADEFFGRHADNSVLGKSHALREWRMYQAGERKNIALAFLTVFSPDESQVLLDHDIPRDDSKLIECVETMSAAADGSHAQLKIVEIPDDVDFTIEEYDGQEHIAEKHWTWS